jgi:hypothetical protein
MLDAPPLLLASSVTLYSTFAENGTLTAFMRPALCNSGVIVESEDIHRMAYNATFEHFDVRCPGGEGPVVWTEEYYDDLQNRVGRPRLGCCGKPRSCYPMCICCGAVL